MERMVATGSPGVSAPADPDDGGSSSTAIGPLALIVLALGWIFAGSKRRS
ncbi:MAG: hypothetical protein OET44_14825 [Gammaproteobacteria bacterium]|nr:hypothetical protein [Gammaproteobacteria bacterium]